MHLIFVCVLSVRSEYNIAPDANVNQIDDFLKARLETEKIPLSSLETEVRIHIKSF